MGVDQAVVALAVSGEVELHDAVCRDGLDEGVPIEAVVLARNEDVVHVEQQPAIGAAGQFAHEFPLGHLRLGKLDVGGDVLDGDAAAEIVLHAGDAGCDVGQRFLGIGDRHEVVQVDAMHARPAEVVGDPFRLDMIGEGFQAFEIGPVERRGGGDGHRHAMHHQRVAFLHAVEHVAGAAAGLHVVLGDDLEPVDGRGRVGLENFGVMLGPEAKAEAKERGAVDHHAPPVTVPAV